MFRSASTRSRISNRHMHHIIDTNIRVDGFQFDPSCMTQPAFSIQISVLFKPELQSNLMISSWRTNKTFEDFEILYNHLKNNFPDLQIQTLPSHRRRSFLRLDRNRRFLDKRCRELGLFLNSLIKSHATLFQFPHAPAYIRYFCDFDNNFRQHVNSVAQSINANPRNISDIWKSEPILSQISTITSELSQSNKYPDTRLSNEHEEELYERRSSFREKWKHCQRQFSMLLDPKKHSTASETSQHSRDPSLYIISDPINDLYRDRLALLRELNARNLKEAFSPTHGPTALLCILYHFCRYEDLESSLALRKLVVQYGLLYVQQLHVALESSEIGMKRKLYDIMPSDRVGTLEFVLVATILNLSIRLIIRGRGEVHAIHPIASLPSLREGELMNITLGYIPRNRCSASVYTLAEEIGGSEQVQHATFMGMEGMKQKFTEMITNRMQDTCAISHFDIETANSLNQSVLSAVWNDCQHNPNLFQIFRRHAIEFGKHEITAIAFLNYLILAFSTDGALYLIDFLLHVLPDPCLRRELYTARWHYLRMEMETESS